MSTVVSIAIAALSAVTAVASFSAYLYFARRSDLVAAREEALALAETRRQANLELREQVKLAEERLNRVAANSERRIRDLQATLDRTRAQARRDAYQTQHFYAAALSDLANDLLADLERTPPDVEDAIVRIRNLLGSTHSAKRRGSARE